MLNDENIIKNYFREGKFIFLYNVFERLTFFAFYISIAHYIDKENYGFIVSVFAFTNIFSSIFDFGLPFFIQRERALGKISEKELMHLLIFRFVMVFLLLPIPVIYFWNENNKLNTILLISLINFYNSFNQILTYYLYGEEKFKENFISLLLTRLILFPLLVIYTHNKVSENISLFTILIILVMQTFYQSRYIVLRRVLNHVQRYNLKIIYQIVKYSLPFGFGIIFTVAYDRISILILRYYTGDVEVAIFSVAYSLIRHTSIFSNAILSQVYSRYSKIFLYREINPLSLKTESISLIVLAVSLILIFNCFGDFFIKILFSDRFLKSFNYLKSLSFAIPFIFLNNFTGVILNSIKHEFVTMITTLICLIINIMSNMILIPEIKTFGAIYSTIITESALLLLQLMYLLKIHKKVKKC